MIFPAQLLHGVIVAGVVVGAPLYVEQSIPERLRSTGQGMLAMLGFGLGGVVSNVASGWLLDHFGATAPALAGGLGALGLALLLPFLLPAPGRASAPGRDARSRGCSDGSPETGRRAEPGTR